MTAPSGHRPLIAFTALAIAAAGLVSVAAGYGQIYGARYESAVAAGTVLLACGLAVSLSHLGQKRRAGLAVRAAGHSALSNEGLLAGLALVTAAVAAGPGLTGAHARTATVVAGVTNAALLVSIGLVYRIRGQRTWQGFSAFTPLTAGLAFGAIALQSMPAASGVFRATPALIAIDALVFLLRWREVAAIPVPTDVLAKSPLSRRDQLLGARFFLLDVVPAVILIAWPSVFAVLVAAAGLVVDRVGFYALAIRHDTEHEIAVVEDVIDALGRPKPR